MQARIKCLTLSQPWATLVAIRAKKIETRGWATVYRGPLAIHAGKGLGPVGGRRGFVTLCNTEPFRSVLHEHFPDMMKRPALLWELPQGAIIAVCELTAVHRVPATPCRFPRGVGDDHKYASYPVTLPPFRDDVERAFGDYTPGRYAWILEDIQRLDAPVECRGALGLWEWKEVAIA